MKQSAILLFCATALLSGVGVACDSESNALREPDPEPIAKVEPLPEMIRPIFTDGKRWVKRTTTYNSDFTPKAEETFTQEVAGDTVVQGIAAKAIRAYNDDGSYPDPYVMYEDGSKIYQLWKTRPYPVNNPTYEFKLLYDIFPAEGATSLTLYDITIISRGVITLMGKERRAAKVWSGFYFFEKAPYDYWVEGIGPLFNITPNYNTTIPSTPMHVWGGHCTLLECYDGEEKIYDYREFSDDLYRPLEVFSDADINEASAD